MSLGAPSHKFELMENVFHQDRIFSNCKHQISVAVQINEAAGEMKHNNCKHGESPTILRVNDDGVNVGIKKCVGNL